MTVAELEGRVATASRFACTQHIKAFCTEYNIVPRVFSFQLLISSRWVLYLPERATGRGRDRTEQHGDAAVLCTLTQIPRDSGARCRPAS